MDRRTFVTGALAALGAPRIALAQPSGKIPRVGIMFAPPIPNAFMDAFQRGLRELGYVEGKNIQVEYRSVAGSFDRYPALAAELVRLPVDVIVAGGGTPAIRAAKQATGTIPIVFPASRDPVDEGFVQSLARPGGNLTGTSILESEINAKRMQLLKEVLPRIQRIAVLFDLQPGSAQVAGTERAARALGLQVVWEHRAFPASGGLMSYGPDIADLYRSAARYVDKILKGAKPSELPVEQASKLELVINLKTAKAQRVTIPPTILVRADQIIE